MDMGNAKSGSKPLLGEILVNTGMISSQHLLAALDEQARTGDLLGEILVRRGKIGPMSLTWALTHQKVS